MYAKKGQCKHPAIAPPRPNCIIELIFLFSTGILLALLIAKRATAFQKIGKLSWLWCNYSLELPYKSSF
jgi:hypothetical protein